MVARHRHARILVCVVALLASTAALRARTWTDATGRTIEADFVRFEDDETVVLRRDRDGKEFTVPVHKFSDADLAHLNGLRGNGPAIPVEEPSFTPVPTTITPPAPGPPQPAQPAPPVALWPWPSALPGIGDESGFRNMALANAMFVLLFLGAGVNLVAWVWILILAFKDGCLWTLIVVIVPFGLVAFIIKDWANCKRPALLYLVGFCVQFAAVIGLVVAVGPS